MRLLFTILLFTYSLSSIGQENQFVGMHGLQDDKGELFFEYQGYNIVIKKLEGSLNSEKTLQRVIKDNNLGTVLANYKEETFSLANIVLESESTLPHKPKAISNNACYLFQREGKYLEIIVFQTLNQRDILLEHDIINAYHNDALRDYIHVGNTATTINFIGREISLGNLCNWLSPNNVSCKGGQISWSEFPSYQEAIVDLQAKVLSNEHPDLQILNDQDVNIIFEGVATIARRIVYMSPDRQYPLAVYYIAQEVRERFVSCVLSNYVYNRDDHELSLFLQQVMQYAELPENARNEFDRVELEEPHSIRNYWSRYNIYGASVRLGTWIPIGNTSKLYSIAPSVSATFGIPVKRDMAVDFSILLAFPVSRRAFDYYLDDTYWMEAKADMLIGFGVRYRYQKEMARNVYFTPYIGTGYHSLSTNQLKYEARNDDENDEYYNIDSFDAYGGVDIRFKRFGAFLEYHYTPYFWSKHAKKDLGNSAINTGFYFVLW